MDGGKQRDKSKIAELFPIIREIRNQDLADRIAAALRVSMNSYRSRMCAGSTRVYESVRSTGRR